jgi:hypothetical protein
LFIAIYMYVCVMKRALAILLLFVSAMTAAQPTLAFHFCRGSLYAVGIGSAGRMCCAGAMNDAPDASDAEAATLSGPSCCTGYTLEISTDACRPHGASPVAVPTDLFPVSFLPSSPVEACDLPARRLLAVFPPGISPRYASERLAWMCVRRE